MSNMLQVIEEGTINFAYSRQVDHSSGFKRRSSLNFLEGISTKLSFLALRFLVSKPQAVYKTYLLLLHYVIVVVAS